MLSGQISVSLNLHLNQGMVVMSLDVFDIYKYQSTEVVNYMEDIEQQWRSLCEQLDFTVDETNKQRKAVELILVRVNVLWILFLSFDLITAEYIWILFLRFKI